MFCCVVVFHLFGFIYATGGNPNYDSTLSQGLELNYNNILKPSIKPDGEITTITPDPTKETKSAMMTPPPIVENSLGINILWIGLGIGIFILVFIVQTVCMIIYTQKVKSARRTIEDIIRSKELNRDDSKARYSKTPEKAIKNSENIEACHYESLPELNRINKKPPPPPIETLPRVPHSNPLPEPLATPKIHIIPPRTVPVNYFHQTASMPRNRERLPTPKEIDYVRDPKHQKNRSPMPLPHEVTAVKPSTLPSRSRKNSLNVRPKHILPAQIVTGENLELLSKLKRRAAMNESTTSSTSSVSPPTLPKPVSQQTKKIARAPSPKLPRPRYENDSDEEWEMEQLKPLNLYNV
ncbi:pollen-specific leucine-rich repeat extensin-like protein 2 [Vanessa atalanta]|uniref:pollen-specific leucine-rich repeat extensin-like protein 2 n=1 Tax=Vanessa atalanta TaxID=42275 RepID=UPI001FCCCDE8|nr:pollen-specific leucine-rich repeat extensin-like protein 2 [Vanessa atalanta]